VRAEIHLFLFDGFLDANLVDDIFLGSVLDTDVTHSECNLLVKDHTLGTGTSVHDINFGNDTDSSNTFRVDLYGHLKTIRDSHIGVGGDHTKNNSSWITHVAMTHVFGDFLDVLILSSDRNTGDTGEIDES
jgi:hypothetical protein